MTKEGDDIGLGLVEFPAGIWEEGVGFYLNVNN